MNTNNNILLDPPATHPNQMLWEKGNYCAIADFMRESGKALVHSLDLKLPLRALDLCCGDGNTAVPLAQRGVEVVGVDISRNLLANAQCRAEAAQVASRLRLLHGDASRLTLLASQSFDLTLSIFGAMFALAPAEVAREMVRVTKSGGRIIMGNWIANDPKSFVSQLLRVSANYAPPPPAGFISPMRWGDPEQVTEWFGGAGIAADRISFQRDSFTFRCAGSPEEFINTYRRFYGPTMNAYAAAEQQGRVDRLHRELVALAEEHAVQTDHGITVPATYLRVTVQC